MSQVGKDPVAPRGWESTIVLIGDSGLAVHGLARMLNFVFRFSSLKARLSTLGQEHGQHLVKTYLHRHCIFFPKSPLLRIAPL